MRPRGLVNVVVTVVVTAAVIVALDRIVVVAAAATDASHVVATSLLLTLRNANAHAQKCTQWNTLTQKKNHEASYRVACPQLKTKNYNDMN